jgi:hypothetical protein
MDNNLKLVLAQLGMNLSQSLGDAMTAHFNPQVFEQQQQNRRQQMQLDQQMQLHNSISPYEQAQLDAARQNHTDALAQQSLENQRQQGLDTWNALKGGATFAATGQQPDFSMGGHGFLAPRTHSIHKDSAVGVALGLDEDLDGLSSDEYAHWVIPALEKLSVAGDKKAQSEANSKALEAQLPSNLQLITARFQPSHYSSYGAVDPLAQSLATDFTNRLKSAHQTDLKNGTMAATASVMRDLSTYESPWEKARQAQLNRQVEINARVAQNLTNEQDRSYQFSQGELNHLAGPVETQARELGQLQSTLSQGTPAADALVAPQLIRVIGQMNRSSEPEMQRVVGGRSAWQSPAPLVPHPHLKVSHLQRVMFPSMSRQWVMSPCALVTSLPRAEVCRRLSRISSREQLTPTGVQSPSARHGIITAMPRG